MKSSLINTFMRINGSASWNNKHENFSAKKSGIFYITPPILVLEAKFEYSCNSYEISDQMSYTKAHKKNHVRVHKFPNKFSK